MMPNSAYKKVEVWVVDDNEEMRDSIQWTLASVGCKVQTFGNVMDCLNAIEPSQPYCIVLDLLLPKMTGIQFIEKLLPINANCAVDMISGHSDVRSVVEAMKLGAVDFLTKPFSREELLGAVNDAIDQAFTRFNNSIHEDMVADRIGKLSVREQEVLECISNGLVTKQIGARLGISPRTVDVHRANISSKLGIDSPMQLAHTLLLYCRWEERQNRSTRRPST